MQLSGFGWGLLAGPVAVLLGPSIGIDTVQAFGAVVLLGFMLGFAGYMRSKRPWWDVGRRETNILERIGRVWCKITGRHLYQRKAHGIRQCALCGWGEVDMDALSLAFGEASPTATQEAVYKVERPTEERPATGGAEWNEERWKLGHYAERDATPADFQSGGRFHGGAVSRLRRGKPYGDSRGNV